MKPLLFKLIAVTLSVLAGFLFCEFIFLIFDYRPHQFVQGELYSQVNRLYQPNSTALWCGQYGSVCDFKNVVRTNSLALHDADHPFEKESDAYRILCLGDSYVEAFQIPLEKTFFKILENKLNSNASLLSKLNKKKIEIIAIGRSGFGMMDEYAELNKNGFRFSPDLVITFFLDQNDFMDDLERGTMLNPPLSAKEAIPQKPNPAQSLFIRKEMALYEKLLIIKKSRLNQLMAFKIVEFSRRHRVKEDRVAHYARTFWIYEMGLIGLFDPLRNHWLLAFNLSSQTILAMKNSCMKNQACFLFVIINNPFRYAHSPSRNALFRLIPQLKDKLNFDQPIHRLKEYLNNQGIRVLDLNDYFELFSKKTKKATEFEHDGHWNMKGHQLTADILEKYLLENHFN